MTTMPTTADLAGARPCDPAQPAAGLERTRFFARQLVGPDDLTQDQVYFREKARRHNRMLHGWGVVCGACVRRGATDCEVVIEPGYLLGPWGDEIVIDREVTVDVCKQGAGEQSGCCGDELDPWCADVRGDCPEGRLYLAVRYAECQARPVRSGGCGCGCDDAACEYSRVRDSFAVKLLRDLPPPYTTPMQQPNASALVPCVRDRVARRCPPCAPGPWVILADVLVGADCRVRAVDCLKHRRYVMSFADYYLTCAPAAGQYVAPAAGPDVLAGRVMTMMTGAADLVDTRGALAGEPPRATVTLARGDGSPVVVPAYFTVRAGETVGELLDREGDRELYDPVTDQALTLRALYEGAGVDQATSVGGVAVALALLDGRPFNPST
ncbi:hypothetical protein tb265_49100 [Gemmatimonadetes bacterium T265]|nr:hypothetical protein tb265_49100 [Gemmatimonadetes bacterium T265]